MLGAVSYAALILIALCLCWLAYLGYSIAGHVLILWVGTVVLILPYLDAIPEAALLTMYSLACFALLSIIALYLPEYLTQKAILKDLRRLLQGANQRLDNERKRLTSAIHDEINPQLILAKLEIEALNRWIEKSSLSTTDKTDLYEFAVKARRLIQSGYDLGRSIMNESRAEVLESIGLINAVRGLVDHYANVLENIHFKLDLPKESASLSLSKAQTDNLFSILREGVLNAVKHAQASNVQITIRPSATEVLMEVTDDGTGVFHNNSNGLGLIDMQERAIAIGANLSIKSKPGKGTTLGCRLPRS